MAQRGERGRRSVLLLDIDGVLNSGPYLSVWLKLYGDMVERDNVSQAARFRAEAEKIDRLAVQRLNRIISVTGAQVVVCSSWRHFHPLHRLRRLLRERGFIGSVIGVTPAISDAERGVECAVWLATHPGGVWSFAALDDDDDYQPIMGRLVKTSSKTKHRDGLEDRHVVAAIDLLRTPAATFAPQTVKEAKKLMARALPIKPLARLFTPYEARLRVDEMYVAHGYSNVVLGSE